MTAGPLEEREVGRVKGVAGRPAVAVVLLASGDAGRLEAAIASLQGPCRDYGAQLVVVWPQAERPGFVGSEVVTLSVLPESTAGQRRGLATQRCGSDIMIFTDESRACQEDWSEALAERLGMALHWETVTVPRDWHAILRSLGVVAVNGH